MSKLKVEDYQSTKRWIAKIVSRGTRSDRSVRIYLWHLKRYCEWAKKTPDELIQEHLSNRNSESEEKRRAHEEMLTQYFVYLETQRKLSRNTALLAHAAIRSFYKANYAPLSVETPESWSTRQDRVPTREEVAKIVQAAPNPLAKALIAFSVQSGQRVGVITALRYSMVKEALASKGPGRIHVPADLKDSKGRFVNKRRQVYDFFIGEDAKTLLKEYLATRGEIKEDDLVFVSEKKIKGREVALDDEAVNRILRKAALNAKIFSQAEVKRLRHHALRKFFQTAMEEAGVAPTWYEYMMGHTLPRTQRAYSKPTIQQLQEAYAKAEPKLSLSVSKQVKEDDGERVKLLVWRENLRLLNLDPEALRAELVQKLGREPTVKEELRAIQEEFQKRLRVEAKPEKKFTSKIVAEEEVAKFIEEGWEPVMQLANGKVVMRKSS